MKSETEVADAQIAGLLLGVSALLGELRRKQLLDGTEIHDALERLAADIAGSRLAQAAPDDSMVTATLAPIRQLQHMNNRFDDTTGKFNDWIDQND